MKTPISIKRIVIDFMYIREQLKEFFKDKKEYQPIIEFLHAKDYLDEEQDIPFPKLKDVELETGLKPHTLRKLLLEMHGQIFNYTGCYKLSFKKVLYHFHIKFYDKLCYFTMGHLEHLPRVGEGISLPFVTASLDISYFYVEDIRHEFDGVTQNIYFILGIGQYNQYWQFMKDRAIELKEVSYQDMINLSELDLKRKIYSKNPYR
ncbi:hypothetical protein [Flavobacterium suncheonense]|uniref:Uncharacterized protein n=1 Tax=Flavobacterium suncheonense GH29-5 = DSM 17707 TaxID=1121899 RepID=A0A0A2ML12_9FLAO|nr:hypothetical protein [Flavobacterium suncheonense]KGO89000.1 hypothetical protein Q764_10375 [Flavobacterium suncheonense GH29-5 = DSM 17707]